MTKEIGPGVILIQSTPFEKFVSTVAPPVGNRADGTGGDGELSG
jgi:hypothetical protein